MNKISSSFKHRIIGNRLYTTGYYNSIKKKCRVVNLRDVGRPSGYIDGYRSRFLFQKGSPAARDLFDVPQEFRSVVIPLNNLLVERCIEIKEYALQHNPLD